MPDFLSAPPTRRITVLAQDPSILDQGRPLLGQIEIPNERLDPGPRGHRVHVIDYDVDAKGMLPPTTLQADVDPYASSRQIDLLVSDPKFHALNVFGHVNATLLHFERALGRHLTWGFSTGAHQLKVAPHAFLDANAFYSREDEALLFGYFPKTASLPKSARSPTDYVFTCLAPDIVVHETTHAILDCLRTEYFRPASPDQAAFHEGFSDIVALLSGLSQESLLRFALPAARGDRPILRRAQLTEAALRDSTLFKLGQEFAKGEGYGDLQEQRGNALRQSLTIKPNGRNYEQLSEAGEAHDLGELLVAAVLTAFIAIWVQRIAPLDPTGKGLFDPRSQGIADRERVVEEGAKAARHLLRISIRAIDYMPPVNILFGDFLAAMLTADREVVADQGTLDYRGVLRESFASYGIDASKPSTHVVSTTETTPLERGAWRRAAQSNLIYGFDRHAVMQWDREAVARFVWENSGTLGLYSGAHTRIVSVRPAVRVAPDGVLVRETVAEYLQLIDVSADELPRLGLKAPNGMQPWTRVRLQGGGTLIFDDYGLLKYHIVTRVRGQRQQTRLQNLYDRGEFDRSEHGARKYLQLHQARAMRQTARRRDGW